MYSSAQEVKMREYQINRYTDGFGSSDYTVCAYIGKQCVENYGVCSSYAEAEILLAKVAPKGK